MNIVALYSKLRDVEVPDGGYGALPLSARDKWGIGRSTPGGLALLVEEVTDATIRTQRLDVASNLKCHVEVGGRELRGVFTVVHLRDHDPGVEEYFVDLCVALERLHS